MSNSLTFTTEFISFGGYDGLDPNNSWNYELAQIINKSFVNKNDLIRLNSFINFNPRFILPLSDPENDEKSVIVSTFNNILDYQLSTKLIEETLYSILLNLYMTMVLKSNTKIGSLVDEFSLNFVPSIFGDFNITLDTSGSYIQKSIECQYLVVSYAVINDTNTTRYSLSIDGGSTVFAEKLISVSLPAIDFLIPPYEFLVNGCDIYNLNTYKEHDVRITLTNVDPGNFFLIRYIGFFNDTTSFRPLLIWNIPYNGEDDDKISRKITLNSSINQLSSQLKSFNCPVSVYDADTYNFYNPQSSINFKFFGQNLASIYSEKEEIIIYKTKSKNTGFRTKKLFRYLKNK